MQNRSFSSLMGLVFIAYALGTLILVLFLSLNPPYIEEQLSPPTLELPSNTQVPDMSQITHIPERKRVFIGMLMPMIEARNQFLRGLRAELLAMREQIVADKPLTRQQRQRLEQLRIRYHVDTERFPAKEAAIDKLLLRVDELPPSMVLAQAAAESGWGTSRFAQEANNLFGQWCFTEGCGLVPARRPDGARHEVQVFKNVEAAVQAYYRNINTHRAYESLRHKRAALREAGEPLTGYDLVSELRHYSSRGQDYIDELFELIRFNQLEQAKAVWLEERAE